MSRGGEAKRTGGNCDQIALLDARLHDLDTAARRLQFAKPDRPGLWREILQAAHHRTDIGIERRGQQRMNVLKGCSGQFKDALNRRMIRRGVLGNAAVQLHMFGARNPSLNRGRDPIDRGIVEYEIRTLRNAGQSDNAAARDAPVDNHLGLSALGQSRGRLELRDQKFWRVNLCDHQNVAEPRSQRRHLGRRLIGRLRLQHDGRVLTVNLQTERIARDSSFGTIIDAP